MWRLAAASRCILSPLLSAFSLCTSSGAGFGSSGAEAFWDVMWEFKTRLQQGITRTYHSSKAGLVCCSTGNTTLSFVMTLCNVCSVFVPSWTVSSLRRFGLNLVQSSCTELCSSCCCESALQIKLVLFNLLNPVFGTDTWMVLFSLHQCNNFCPRRKWQ